MKIGQGIAGIVAFAIALSARAELGGPPTWQHSGAGEGVNFSQSSGNARASYTVNQTSLPAGSVVREYIAAGTVFAIAWQGTQMPPLNTLLGAYFPSYKQGLNALRATRTSVYGPSRVEQADLVVQSGGHMGSFTGRAYLPQALPQGVSTGDIQ